MKISTLITFSCMLALVVALTSGSIAYAADQPATLESSKELEEMPVLIGSQWQTLQPDTKIAFIWGVGHVVTIEEHVVKRHPELQRQDFVAKLATGLRGIPMNTIIKQVDDYYRANPDNLDLPVMRVIWRQIVKPKLKTGIADTPLKDND